MSLNVVYVEHNRSERNGLSEAVTAANKSKPLWCQVELQLCATPENLKEYLNDDVDLILSDVHFPSTDSDDDKAEDPKRLGDIIKTVREFDKKSSRGFPLPIIAYTARGPDTLHYCQEFRDELYDIWHKMSANPPYVTWRFQRLEDELRRQHPDACIQKLIAAMAKQGSPVCYSHVKAMVRSYGEGRTEYDQVLKCRTHIQSVVDELVPTHVKPLMGVWNNMVEYESLLRAASPSLRGISGHSINVFWLGYWLLNNSLLRPVMVSLWDKMVQRRQHNAKIVSMDSSKMLTTVWLLASFFHDTGKFAEDGVKIIDGFNKSAAEFVGLGIGCSQKSDGSTTKLESALKDILFGLSQAHDDPQTAKLKEYVTNTLGKQKPDHGAVAAAKLVDLLAPHRLTPNRDMKADQSKDEDPLCFCAMEAVRAILLHSCFPPLLDMSVKIRPLQWDQDPIACLLLFCDQIQTWDRHGVNDNYRRDYPDRAELLHLDLVANQTVGSSPSIPKLTGCIDYIAPRHVEIYPVLRRRVAEDLYTVLLEKPKHSLIHLIEASSWPFSVDLECAMSGEPLLSSEQEPMHMRFPQI